MISFFPAFRAQQGDVIRHACRIAPLEAFQIAGEWLQYQINSSRKAENDLCELKSCPLGNCFLCPLSFYVPECKLHFIPF